MNSCALSLTLKQGFGATRQWPIVSRPMQLEDMRSHLPKTTFGFCHELEILPSLSYLKIVHEHHNS